MDFDVVIWSARERNVASEPNSDQFGKPASSCTSSGVVCKENLWVDLLPQSVDYWCLPVDQGGGGGGEATLLFGAVLFLNGRSLPPSSHQRLTGLAVPKRPALGRPPSGLANESACLQQAQRKRFASDWIVGLPGFDSDSSSHNLSKAILRRQGTTPPHFVNFC